MKVINSCDACGVDFMYDPNHDLCKVNNTIPNRIRYGVRYSDLLILEICHDCLEAKNNKPIPVSDWLTIVKLESTKRQ